MASTNLNIRIAADVGLIASTIDVTNISNSQHTVTINICIYNVGSYCWIALSTAQVVGFNHTLFHVDVDMRTTCHHGFIASTINVVNAGRRDYIDTWILLWIIHKKVFHVCIFYCIL